MTVRQNYSFYLTSCTIIIMIVSSFLVAGVSFIQQTYTVEEGGTAEICVRTDKLLQMSVYLNLTTGKQDKMSSSPYFARFFHITLKSVVCYNAVC